MPVYPTQFANGFNALQSTAFPTVSSATQSTTPPVVPPVIPPVTTTPAVVAPTSLALASSTKARASLPKLKNAINQATQNQSVDTSNPYTAQILQQLNTSQAQGVDLLNKTQENAVATASAQTRNNQDQLQEEQRALQAQQTTQALQTGQARYAPQYAQAEQLGLNTIFTKKISDLQDAEKQAISSAQTAFAQGKYALAEKSMAVYEQLRNAKQEEIQKNQDRAFKEKEFAYKQKQDAIDNSLKRQALYARQSGGIQTLQDVQLQSALNFLSTKATKAQMAGYYAIAKSQGLEGLKRSALNTLNPTIRKELEESTTLGSKSLLAAKQVSNKSDYSYNYFTNKFNDLKTSFGRGDANRTNITALIGEIRGDITKQRGGTALTKTEIKQLNTYLPSGSDNNAQIVTKLRILGNVANFKKDKAVAQSLGLDEPLLENYLVDTATQNMQTQNNSFDNYYNSNDTNTSIQPVDDILK